jgi:hypothetical protein
MTGWNKAILAGALPFLMGLITPIGRIASKQFSEEEICGD